MNSFSCSNLKIGMGASVDRALALALKSGSAAVLPRSRVSLYNSIDLLCDRCHIGGERDGSWSALSQSPQGAEACSRRRDSSSWARRRPGGIGEQSSPQSQRDAGVPRNWPQPGAAAGVDARVRREVANVTLSKSPPDPP